MPVIFPVIKSVLSDAIRSVISPLLFAGTDRTLENGTITALPTSIEVDMNADLKVVTTGSPNFNLTVVI